MKVIKESLNEGKFLNNVQTKLKNLFNHWADYLESDDEREFYAKLQKEIEADEADKRKSDIFFSWGKDLCVAMIQGFVKNYMGNQVWEDIGKEFGDEAIDFALEMVDYGLLHILPSMEAKSALNPEK